MNIPESNVDVKYGEHEPEHLELLCLVANSLTQIYKHMSRNADIAAFMDWYGTSRTCVQKDWKKAIGRIELGIFDAIPIYPGL